LTSNQNQLLIPKLGQKIFQEKIAPITFLTMRPETRKAMEMLFTAKWNLPKAAEHCGLTWKEMKITFNEYCNFHPPTYKPE